jgi:lambda family phage portal protein
MPGGKITLVDENGQPLRRAKRLANAEGALAPTQQMFDAARRTKDNKNHWQHADGASANTANDAETRRVLRNRARYEDANNGYAAGLTGDRANETIGTGPRLQLCFPDTYTDPDFQRTQAVAEPEELARAVELRWKEWAKSVRLLDKLLVMDESETREGEVFGFKFVNPALPADAPQLDLRLYEADQVDTPDLDATDPNAVSGIRFDQFGNPTEYHVLRRHPGETLTWGSFGGMGLAEYDRIPARQIIHWFKPRRAGQARGIPAFTSSLPLYAILRRYTLASLLNAESQARVVGVITNENSLPDADGNDADDETGGEEIEVKGVSLMTLDAGQKANVFGVSHPAPAYGEFKGEILTESGRAINAPRNVSRGSSADYNYSSGRLDQQQWQRAIRIRRERFEQHVLDNLFAEWLRLALLIPGYLPEGLPPVATWKKTWRWDGFVSIDPVKDANAASQRMENGTSTLERECGELGEDWEEVQDQRLREEAREMKRRAKLGLPPKQPKPGMGQPYPAPVPAGAPAEDEDDAEEEAA